MQFYDNVEHTELEEIWKLATPMDTYLLVTVTVVWHLGVKIVMKYATAGFVIYGAPVDQASF